MSGRYIEQFDECVDMRLSSFSVRNDDKRRVLNECTCMMYVLLLCYQPRIEYRSAIAEATKALIGPAVR